MSAGPACKIARCSLLKPIVVVLGATGAGKSKLALELATKFSGEIVNADAMQLYRGLDIVTNKVTKEEQNLCPHHLLDCISPLKSSYSIFDYKISGLKILDDIHNRGKLPVIVGGTNYYIESLLWDFVLNIKSQHQSSSSSDDGNVDLESSTSVKELYDQLMEVDPERAKRIHPCDIRKIKRSLEVFKQTGRTITSMFNEQHGGDDNDTKKLSGPMRYPNSCMIWVKCDKTVLHDRINKRVDEMLESGLMDELLSFHKEYNHLRVLQNKERDYEHGIFQCIGFKEFHQYLITSEEDRQTDKGKKLFLEGVDNMKLVTRQYSKKQVNWIQNRFLRKRGEASLPPVYPVDSSNVERWVEDVSEPALEIVENFLKGAEIKHEALPIKEYDNPAVHNHCHECDMTFLWLDSWQAHMKGGRHKRQVARNKRLKIINIENSTIPEQAKI